VEVVEAQQVEQALLVALVVAVALMEGQALLLVGLEHLDKVTLAEMDLGKRLTLQLVVVAVQVQLVVMRLLQFQETVALA
jgi:hypothetical protein